MRLRTTSAAESAADAARNVEAVGAPARDLFGLIARSGSEVAAAKDATDRTVDDLARTDRTVRSLAAAAERIGMVVKLIESIAAQTSLLSASMPPSASRPRRRRRPRLRGGGGRGEVAGAADRQGDRRHRGPDSRYPAGRRADRQRHRGGILQRHHHERHQPPAHRHPRSSGGVEIDRIGNRAGASSAPSPPCCWRSAPPSPRSRTPAMPCWEPRKT